jgi:hypothetical protein
MNPAARATATSRRYNDCDETCRDRRRVPAGASDSRPPVDRWTIFPYPDDAIERLLALHEHPVWVSIERRDRRPTRWLAAASCMSSRPLTSFAARTACRMKSSSPVRSRFWRPAPAADVPRGAAPLEHGFAPQMSGKPGHAQPEHTRYTRPAMAMRNLEYGFCGAMELLKP